MLPQRVGHLHGSSDPLARPRNRYAAEIFQQVRLARRSRAAPSGRRKKPVGLTVLDGLPYDRRADFSLSRTPYLGWLFMSSRASHPQLFLRGLAVPLAALAAVGAVAIVIARELLQPRELQAAPTQRQRDPDQDGLVNGQENVLGTNRFQADTDGDGFSDLEEFARKSSPLFAESAPTGNEISIAITCRGGDTGLHALIALYLPDGKLRDKRFRAGMLLAGRTVALSERYLLRNGTLAMYPAQDPNARIATLDLPLTARFVRQFGHMTVFATLGDAPLGVAQTADSMHLLAFGQLVVLELQNPMVLGTAALTGGGQQTGSIGGVGSIYVPLPMGGGVPDWTPGQVCFQQTSLIGVAGPKVTQEVTSAECQTGWDGYCPSSCASTVGNTYTTIDPVALIGG